ncbi:HAD-IIIC family phosphatase [Acetobacteraceae bacterium]|nr:HAD-IIIC family phosphatase [Acetobacteraceae bacterium]
MLEAVRLVIWDLDETFWQGTLSEGGVAETSHHGDIVRELNKRGIMSSICSKNDFETAKAFLEGLGIWDQFIFPSIDWTAKGNRVVEIIKKVQLRPESILFLDDNPMNLAEVSAMVPNIQVHDEKFIPELLASPLFEGKPDPEMTRLAHYKIMESKQAEISKIDGNNFDFLRNSEITVEINYDIEGNIDRVIELLNRTNQLNFTKNRLSDDIEKAREQVRDMNRGALFEHTGLVHVRDKFGDYGLVGFFQQFHNTTENKLLHFCFSCRILSMHVETWLYQQFEKPELFIKGEVANNPKTDSAPVDWIKWYDPALSTSTEEMSADFNQRPPLLISGGCETESIQHYIRNVTNDFRIFTGTTRDGFIIRRDHSCMVRIAAEKYYPAQGQLIRTGYKDEDFSISFDNIKNGLIILTFWADISFKIHKLSWIDSTAPYTPPGVGHGNFQEMFEDNYYQNGGKEEWIEQFRFAKANLKYKGAIGSLEFKDNLTTILKNIDPSNKVFFMLPALHVPDHHPEWGFLDRARLLSMCQVEVARDWPNVECISFDQFIEDPSEVTDYDHFTRIVYQRCGFYLRNLYLKEVVMKSESNS